MSSKEIQVRQNQELQLKIQYAARECYNTAEKLNYWVWGLCILSFVIGFLPNESGSVLLSVGSILCDVLAFLLNIALVKKNSNAAMLRKHFDDCVLKIGCEECSTSRETFELVEKICAKHPQKFATQIKNGGTDSPPGVKDWYSFSKKYEGSEAQFECQRMNAWWDSKLSQWRLGLAITSTVILMGAVFYLAPIKGIWTIIVCLVGIMLKLIERAREYILYYQLSYKISGVMEIIRLNQPPDEKALVVLQDLINQRRSTSVFGVNFVYEKLAKPLTDLYRRISEQA